ncbi:MAG: NRDE family protein [Desulfobacterales bacterium]|nr:NRDE family protein [Desulfobacterales bacterium]
MCLLVLAVNAHPDYKLIVAGNRDEYYDRPAARAAFWEEAPHLLAGKDLRHNGTWFGVTRQGRIGAVTSYRDPASFRAQAPTRGELITKFLLGRQDPLDYLNELAPAAEKYNGFNLIAGVKDRLYWYSNSGGQIRLLEPGIHGLSNKLLDTPWPKTVRARVALGRLISKEKYPSPGKLFQILQDRTPVDDRQLPHTGVPLEWERLLSSIFIESPTYGTRSSTLLYLGQDDRISFHENTFDKKPNPVSSVKFDFQITHT